MEQLPDDPATRHRKNRHKHLPPSVYPSTTRIEAFSDGVIAIILTIMVLELKVPALAQSFSVEDFWREARHLWPKLTAYAMSFVIVAIFWVNHHGFFHFLKKSDGKLLWYNNYLLFWLSLIPFATAFLGEHPTSPEAVMWYGFVLMMAALAFPLIGHYAMFRSNLMHDDITPPLRQKMFRRNFPGLVLYTLSVVLAPVSIWISWLIFFVVPLYYFMPRQLTEEGS